MRVIVTGVGKTATTAVGVMLSEAFKVPYIHEPKNKKSIAKFPKTIKKPGAVVKVNIYYINDSVFDSFDKKILMLRDPRDRLISNLLFCNYQTWLGDEKRAKRFVEKFRQKEVDPSSVSVRELLESFQPIPSFNAQSTLSLNKDTIEFAKKHPDYLWFRYEDFVADRLAGVEDYCGVELSPAKDVDVGKRFNHVIRSKGTGAWRHWFLPSDVEYFKPYLNEYMDFFNYGPQFWDTVKQEERTIHPENCSLYLKRIINHRRKKANKPPLFS